MDYEQMTVDELHEFLKGKGVGGIWDLSKAELVEVAEELDHGDGGGGGAKARGEDRGGERGEATDEELPPGKSATTRDHERIRRWAEKRGATPATVPGTEHGDHLGVLRFDFPGYGGEELRHVSWDEWLKTFDARHLEFLYQDRRKDRRPSNFFRLLNPDREDA